MATPSIPSLIPHQTLRNPTLGSKTWSSQPHPSPTAPLLATAVSDKSVHVWDMRDWKLISTISGGHKRSVRCVGWKDYGGGKRKRGYSGDDEENVKKDPVLLATGSFDANCGLWVWNRGGDSVGAAAGSGREGSVPGGFDDDGDADVEQDFTNQADGDGDEDWHFSTLLTGPDSEIKGLQFSPAHYGANLLATSSRDKSVWVWEEVEPEEWETVAVLSEHTGDVKCVQWLAGARTSRKELGRRLGKRRNYAIDASAMDEEEEIVLGGRELLASGAYDDTIRLHHDDEAEGDWMSIAVLTGHDGTVWDLKFESYVNLASYPAETRVEEVIADWAPRLMSCSDDMTIRVWKKDLNEKERDERKMRIADARQGQNAEQPAGRSDGPVQTGFSSNRLPSVIRPPTSTEQWSEESRLPTVHVRSVYAIDWSPRTGLVVSCGGDGLIAVYREVATSTISSQDVVMNGTSEAPGLEEQDNEDIKKVKTEWKVVAMIDAAHDEYEVNHVCWAVKRDHQRNMEIGENGTENNGIEEEYIVSTGDDGDVKIWRLPQELLADVWSS